MMKTEVSSHNSNNNVDKTPPRLRARPRTPSPQTPLRQQQKQQLLNVVDDVKYQQNQDSNNNISYNSIGVDSVVDYQQNQSNNNTSFNSIGGSLMCGESVRSMGGSSTRSGGSANSGRKSSSRSSNITSASAKTFSTVLEDEFNDIYLYEQQTAAAGGRKVRDSNTNSSGGRPDPEENIYRTHQQHEQVEHLVPSRPSQQYSKSQLQGGQPHQYILEQDDVSLMSMTSVTQQMRQNQQRQRQEQQHQHRTIKETLSSASVSSSSSSSTSSSSSSTSSSSVLSPSNEAMMKIKAEEDDEIVINPCDYNELGWCRRHPSTVRMRKKKLVSGWQVLLSQCPQCCLDEMMRIQRLSNKEALERQSSSKGEGESLAGFSKKSNSSKSSSHKKSTKGSSSKASKESNRGSSSKVSKESSIHKESSHQKTEKKSNKKKTEKMSSPPIKQLHLVTRPIGNDGNEGDETRSVGTASTITMTHSSVSERWQNHRTGSYNSSDDIARVTRMPYTDPHGGYGWYTGEVNSSTGAPNGIGTMNYADGDVVSEGLWHNGIHIPDDNSYALEQSSTRLSTRVVVHHNNLSPRIFQQGKRSQTHLATLNEDSETTNEYNNNNYTGSSSGSQTHSSSRSQQQQHYQGESSVVCGMRWTDRNGDMGSFTGEVNHFDTPDGMGSMRYDYGMVVEGLWRDGEFVYTDDH